MSGRACRLLLNDYIRELDTLATSYGEHALPTFPYLLGMTSDIRKASVMQKDRSVATVLCSSNLRELQENVPARVIFDRIVNESEQACLSQ